MPKSEYLWFVLGRSQWLQARGRGCWSKLPGGNIAGDVKQGVAGSACAALIFQVTLKEAVLVGTYSGCCEACKTKDNSVIKFMKCQRTWNRLALCRKSGRKRRARHAVGAVKHLARNTGKTPGEESEHGIKNEKKSVLTWSCYLSSHVDTFHNTGWEITRGSVWARGRFGRGRERKGSRQVTSRYLWPGFL